MSSSETRKAPARTPPRLLQVVRSRRITRSMQRITLGGDELRGFPEDRNGAHIKVFLPRPGQIKPVLPTLGERGPIWPPADQRPITRTYSVRRYWPERSELDIDFVVHGSTSPASGWAVAATPGDWLGIAGPGGPDPLLSPADRHLLVGDLTALPAISALLEEMPATALGHVLIEIDHNADRQTLVNHSGLQVQWVLRQPDIASRTAAGPLLQIIRNLVLRQPGETLSAFVAGENQLVLGVRDHLREAEGLRKRELYAVPYWRRGQDEETYHEERHRIMDQVY